MSEGRGEGSTGTGTSVGQASAAGILAWTLGPRSRSFPHSGLLLRVFVESSFLVDEPAVSCPEDQVQEAKDLHREPVSEQRHSPPTPSSRQRDSPQRR